MKKALLATLATAVLLAGCAAANYKVHPGAGGYISGTPTTAQLFDSQSYDALSATDAIIQQTRADYQANKFPTSAMPTIRTAFNGLTQAYDGAQSAWLAYDGALKAGQTPSQAALQASLAAMQAAVTELTAAKGGK